MKKILSVKILFVLLVIFWTSGITYATDIIELKLNGVTVWQGTCGTTPSPPTPPPPVPPPIGQLGSPTNPIKIDTPTDLTQDGYIPEGSTGRGTFAIPKGAKAYFVVDPISTIGVSANFKIMISFNSGAGGVCTLTQNKATGAFSTEKCFGSDAYMKVVWNPDPNTRYLYVLDNTYGGGTVVDNIGAIMPF